MGRDVKFSRGSKATSQRGSNFNVMKGSDITDIEVGVTKLTKNTFQKNAPETQQASRRVASNLGLKPTLNYDTYLIKADQMNVLGAASNDLISGGVTSELGSMNSQQKTEVLHKNNGKF